MTTEEETVLMIKGLIFELPEAQREACLALVQRMKEQLKDAGEPVASVALALVGAEAQLAAS